MNITVLGATGGIGRAIASELAARGHEVTGASRRVTPDDLPAGARALPTDVFDPASLAVATRDADVVVAAANLPYAAWASQLLPMADAIATATARADARLVLVDSLYAYGAPDGPMTDATPDAATTRKGVLRAEVTRRLLARHAAGELQVTTGRFSDYYGPGGTNTLVHHLGVARLLAGKAPWMLLDGDQPHTFAYLPDAAHGFATLVEQPEADGRSWIVPAGPPITQRALFTELAAAAGRRGARLGRVTRPMLRLAGLTDAHLRESFELRGQFERPYIALGTDLTVAFGPLPITDHDRALAATWAAAVAGRDAEVAA